MYLIYIYRKIFFQMISAVTIHLDIQTLLTENYNTTFMKHKWDIGLTNVIKHGIDTEGPPVVVNARRQPVHLLKIIEESINEIEKYVIIEKCESP